MIVLSVGFKVFKKVSFDLEITLELSTRFYGKQNYGSNDTPRLKRETEKLRWDEVMNMNVYKPSISGMVVP